MSEKKHRVEVFFDDEEYAALKELSAGSRRSVDKVVYDSVARTHLSEASKNARRRLVGFYLKSRSIWSPIGRR